jgi:protein-L-isoaspartate O-methyltransferase
VTEGSLAKSSASAGQWLNASHGEGRREIMAEPLPVRPEEILRLANAYQRAALLISACQLNVFTLLASGPLTAADLARRCGVAVRGLTRLLNACVATGLLETAQCTYRNTPVAAAFLVQGREGYLGDLVAGLTAEQYAAWGKLTEAIRRDAPVRLQSGQGVMTMPAEAIDNYVRGLYNIGLMAAKTLAERIDLHGRHRLLDVAGGSGVYAIRLAERYAHLQATVFDLPPVVERARTLIAEHRLSQRITVRAGSYLEDDLGSGYDVVLLSNVLQTEGPDTCVMLLEKAWSALEPGGQILINGIMCHPNRTSPPPQTLFSILMYLYFPQGETYPAEEISAWLRQVGFVDPAVIALPPPSINTIVTAVKPAS